MARIKDYRALFDVCLAEMDDKAFLRCFKTQFETLRRLKWSDNVDSCDIADASGNQIPIWEMLNELDDPTQPRFEGVLIFLLNIKWYPRYKHGSIFIGEGPGCWAGIYDKILSALSKFSGADRVYHVNGFLRKLPRMLREVDSPIYQPAAGFPESIRSALKIITQSDLRANPRYRSNAFDSLKHAYEAIREYYHLHLVKQNLYGNDLLLELLKVMIPISPTGFNTIGDFLVTQIIHPEFTLSGLRNWCSRPHPDWLNTGQVPRFALDDFTCEQIAELGIDGIEALARRAAYYKIPTIQTLIQHARTFLDSNSQAMLDNSLKNIQSLQDRLLPSKHVGNKLKMHQKSFADFSDAKQ